jgi:predicted dehydrogenase
MSSVAMASHPRLGFLGVGWIGRQRMDAIEKSGVARVAAVSDPADDRARAALDGAPGARRAASFDELLGMEIDGLVIATPSALHARQSLAALERGLPVFCQKPLGRTAGEAREVVDAARRRNLSLGVDLSYRFTQAAQAVASCVGTGELGDVFAVDLTFHNAYGPDKPWFYDRRLSGGGCLIDLGVHLLDLAGWTLGFPQVLGVSSTLFAAGRRLGAGSEAVEDFAEARLDLAGGAVVRLTCSWRLHAGRDCVVEASFHGTRGGASLRNVDGSFYDFIGERHRGTSRDVLYEGVDDWGGRAAVDWARGVAAGEGFSPKADRLSDLHEVLDRIYGRV